MVRQSQPHEKGAKPMDILMVYWNSIWQNTVNGVSEKTTHVNTSSEWAAYHRSLERAPKIVPAQAPRA
jgi:hypothetical protein